MGQIDWDLLVAQHTQPGAQQVTLGFVVDYYGLALIVRRHSGDYLPGCYELPQGILRSGETIEGAARRILHQDFGLELDSIEQYLHSFTYRSAHEKYCQAFIFSVRVQQVGTLKLNRNDHGLWMHFEQIRSWPIITDYARALLHFWAGEGFNEQLAGSLLEQAKARGIWRYKVRLLLHQEGEFLLLKRARRHRAFPLYYELPGKELRPGQSVDTALIESAQQQTGAAPLGITRYLDFYDYRSANGTWVRELIYAALAQSQSVQFSEHAYAVWQKERVPSNLQLTSSAQQAVAAFYRRFCVELPPRFEQPPVVYFDPWHGEQFDQDGRFIEAVAQLERGRVIDLEALRCHPLRRRDLPKPLQGQWGP